MAKRKYSTASLRATAITDEVRKRVQQTPNGLSAIGNSNRKMQDLAADMINASKLPHEYIAANCFLCTATITRLAEGKTRFPQSETVERVFRFFNTEMKLGIVSYKPRYLNRPKGA